MTEDKKMSEKKLRGSGGYAIAKITDKEQKMANLGGPELFLAGIGRLENDRFEKYYCNKCEQDYSGGPNIEFENPNEDLGENIILIEKGEYKCKTCNYIIAQYRKFDEAGKNDQQQYPDSDSKSESNDSTTAVEATTSSIVTNTASSSNTDESENHDQKMNKEEKRKTMAENAQSTDSDIDSTSEYNQNKKENEEDSITKIQTSEYFPIEKIIGMSTYDSNARLLGKVSEIGLRKITEGKVQFSFKVTGIDNQEAKEITWNNISKIGDIIILGEKSAGSSDAQGGPLAANVGAAPSGSDGSNNNAKNTGSYTTSNITESSGLGSNIVCPNCNHKNDMESIFCEECGKKLAE